MPPGQWTALFFWDEAQAFAAGHRPCAYCRRGDYDRFREAWGKAGLPGRKAVEMDAVLHAARLADGKPARWRADAASLPEGTLISVEGAAVLLAAGAFSWSPEGYRPVPVPAREVEVLTPEPLVRVIAGGYRPAMRL